MIVALFFGVLWRSTFGRMMLPLLIAPGIAPAATVGTTSHALAQDVDRGRRRSAA
jgi:hypothetical protein